MKCNQCERPALYQYDNGLHLCLSCNAILQENNYRSFLMNAAMMNHAMDEMDMVTGIHLGGGRIPVSALAQAMSRPMTNNHITISNSSVGVLNTGDLAKINAVITITEGSDAEELGHTVKTSRKLWSIPMRSRKRKSVRSASCSALYPNRLPESAQSP